MNYQIIHRTTYDYSAPVTASHHVARLKPVDHPGQVCEVFELQISPAPARRAERTDYFGNRLCFFSIQEAHQRLEITSTSRVKLQVGRMPMPRSSAPWKTVAGLFRDPVSPEAVDIYQFVFDSPHIRSSPDLAGYAAVSFPAEGSLLAGARDLTRRIYQDFIYDPRSTTVATPLEEVLEKRRGVCQDFAHLAIGCLRSLGLPARYVSGYLRTRPPEGQTRLVGADASHAWFSVFCPGEGWVGFDPTNNVLPREEHIPVAHGRDFGDVSPVAGILTGGGLHTVQVSVDVSTV